MMMLQDIGMVSSRRQERGIALVTVLVFMVVMTLIGLAAMQSSSLQERMSGNMRDQDVSFQAAEAAARQGEAWVQAQTSQPLIQAGGCVAPCEVVWAVGDAASNASDFLNPTFWSGANLRTGAAIYGARSAPLLVIEDAGFLRSESSSRLWTSDPLGSEIYRITSRGTGITDDAQSVIQTTYAKRF